MSAVITQAVLTEYCPACGQCLVDKTSLENAIADGHRRELQDWFEQHRGSLANYNGGSSEFKLE